MGGGGGGSALDHLPLLFCKSVHKASRKNPRHGKAKKYFNKPSKWLKRMIVRDHCNQENVFSFPVWTYRTGNWRSSPAFYIVPKKYRAEQRSIQTPVPFRTPAKRNPDWSITMIIMQLTTYLVHCHVLELGLHIVGRIVSMCLRLGKEHITALEVSIAKIYCERLLS